MSHIQINKNNQNITETGHPSQHDNQSASSGQFGFIQGNSGSNHHSVHHQRPSNYKPYIPRVHNRNMNSYASSNMNQPVYSGIDQFNKSVINKVINDLKHEHDQTGGMSSGIQNFGGLGAFGGINDEGASNSGLGGLINEDENSINDTLK